MDDSELARLRQENEDLRRRVATLEAERNDLDSRRSEALNEQTRLRQILSQLPLWVNIVDIESMRGVYHNCELDQLLGYPPGALEAMGEKPGLFKVVHPEDIPKTVEYVKSMASPREATTHYEFRMRRGDGTYLHYRTESRPFERRPDGSFKNYLAVSHDITATKRAEEELRQMNEQLDRLVAERTASLEETNALLTAEIDSRTRLAEEAREQARVIRELSAPVIQIWDDVVAVPLLGGLDAERAEAMTQSLLDTVSARGVRYCILDLTAAIQMDAATVEHLHRVVQAVTLLGAEVVLTGIRPAVAQTMAEQGIQIAAKTLRNLREALKHCIRRLSEANDRARPR